MFQKVNKRLETMLKTSWFWTSHEILPPFEFVNFICTVFKLSVQVIQNITNSYSNFMIV